MNLCESRRHYIKYYKLYKLKSTLTKFQFRLTKTFSNGKSQKSQLQCYWAFYKKLTSMLITRWIYDFTSGMKSQSIFYLLSEVYILDTGPWRQSAPSMGFVSKHPSRMQGNFFSFWSPAWWWRAVFGRVQQISILLGSSYPPPIKARRRRFNVPHFHTKWNIQLQDISHYPIALV